MPEFTNDWFGANSFELWNKLLTDFPVHRYLEIGSYEGASACFMMEHMETPAEIVCIDPWDNTPDHMEDMEAVYKRFRANIAELRKELSGDYKIEALRTTSEVALGALRAGGVKEFFDMIYVDGSHTPTDVMADACGAWPMLKTGGIMVFDDYLWPKDEQPRIKHSIDLWCGAYADYIRYLSLGPQLVIQKTGKRNG